MCVVSDWAWVCFMQQQIPNTVETSNSFGLLRTKAAAFSLVWRVVQCRFTSRENPEHNSWVKRNGGLGMRLIWQQLLTRAAEQSHSTLSPCSSPLPFTWARDFLPCLHEPWVQRSAIHNVRKVEQFWNQSTGPIGVHEWINELRNKIKRNSVK